MTKAEKNYRHDYGHKDGEELDNVLETVNFDELKVYGEKLKTSDSRQAKKCFANVVISFIRPVLSLGRIFIAVFL